MKLVYRFATAAAACLLVACGGDDTSVGPSGNDASTATDTGATTDGNVATDAGAGDASDVDAGGDAAAAPTCASYCAMVNAHCTGDAKQYQTDAECMTACALFPVGSASDTSGNTLGCRAYHAVLATSAPTPHCWHAGPFGAGACGGFCEDFCALTTSYCSVAGGYDAGAPPYASLSECLTACAGFAVPDAGAAPSTYNAAGPGSGNTLDCRAYHLGNALTTAANQKVHCPHTAVSSATCK